MSGSRVEFRDLGWRDILSRVKTATSSSVRVGIQEPEAAKIHPGREDITILEVGMINEFGSEAADVPERSFLRSTMREKEGEIVELEAEAAYKVVMEQVPAHIALDRVGKITAEFVQRKILDDRVPPPNAPATIAKKGFDHPLVESGVLAESITHRVVRGTADAYEESSIVRTLASDDYESVEVESGVE